jgi:hypothetical protein
VLADAIASFCHINGQMPLITGIDGNPGFAIKDKSCDACSFDLNILPDSLP